ncbi:MAG: SRPBCC domain-containing protein [Bacteroidota bacterium]
MTMEQGLISYSVIINSPAILIWKMLTDIELLKQWMLDDKIDILTNWEVNSPIIIEGNLHGMAFKNKGTVLKYDPYHTLCYSHLSSLSLLPDRPENYTNIEFKLEEQGGETGLNFTANNFPTETIKQHIGFYWNATLVILKELSERNNLLS